MTSQRDRRDAGVEPRLQIDRLLRALARSGVTATPDYVGDLDREAQAGTTQARAELIDLLRKDTRLEHLDTLGEAELEGLRLQLVRLCVTGRLQQYLADADIPYPIYNFFAGFEENGRGPWDRVSISVDAPSGTDWQLLGLPIRCPVGVPASGLTQNAEWVEYFARRGFNVLTYKTVRSSERRPHRYPHWVFVQDLDPWLSAADVGAVRGDLKTWPKDLSHFSTANSFGVPSPDPTVWQRDVERAMSRLAAGQLLILSVMGSADEETGQGLVEDFVKVALQAEATQIQAIELNLSCPNTPRADTTRGMSPTVSSDPASTTEIVSAVRGALRRSTKLVIKLGYEPRDVLEETVRQVGNSVDGISGINTVQVPIRVPNGDVSPFIGTAAEPDRQRDKAGVSGSAIRELGLDFVRTLQELRRSTGSRFSIIGMGGIMDSSDVRCYHRAGADAVQSATGACLNPELAIEAAEEGSIPPPVVGTESRLEKMFEVIASGGYSLLSGRSRDAT